MRPDKFTSKLQEALADAQSLAIGKDHNMIEPVHLLAAFLEQRGGSVRPLLKQAGAEMGGLTRKLGEAIDRLPVVSSPDGEIRLSQNMARLFNLTDKLAQKRGDQFIASELVLLAMLEDKGDARQDPQGSRRDPRFPAGGDRKRARRRSGDRSQRRGEPSGAGQVLHRHDRTGGVRQAGPGDRP